MITMTRPSFLKSLLDSWQLTLSHGSGRDLIPYWIFAATVFGWGTAYYLPTPFWDGSKLDISVSVVSGILTFNGIVLALCWSAFSKIYEIVGAGAFCAHLRKHNLLNHYLMFVGYCHASQVIAIIFTTVALFALWLPIELWALKAILGASVATSAYAVRQGVATSSAMQDLIWRKSEFDENQQKNAVQPVPAKA